MAEVFAVRKFNPVEFINPTKSVADKKLSPFLSQKSAYKISAH